MAFIPLPGSIKVEMIFSLSGETMVLVWYVTPNGTAIPITSLELGNVIDHFVTAWNTWRTFLNQNARLDSIIATDVSEEDGIQVARDITANQAGTGTAIPTPNNVAVVLTLFTGRTGRSFRGRKYFGGFNNTAITSGGQVGTNLANGLNTGMQALTSALLADGWRVGVASYVSNGAPRVTGVCTPVTSWAVDPLSDSQRRRLPGRGI